MNELVADDILLIKQQRRGAAQHVEAWFAKVDPALAMGDQVIEGEARQATGLTCLEAAGQLLEGHAETQQVSKTRSAEAELAAPDSGSGHQGLRTIFKVTFLEFQSVFARRLAEIILGTGSRVLQAEFIYLGAITQLQAQRGRFDDIKFEISKMVS